MTKPNAQIIAELRDELAVANGMLDAETRLVGYLERQNRLLHDRAHYAEQARAQSLPTPVSTPESTRRSDALLAGGVLMGVICGALGVSVFLFAITSWG